MEFYYLTGIITIIIFMIAERYGKERQMDYIFLVGGVVIVIIVVFVLLNK